MKRITVLALAVSLAACSEFQSEQKFSEIEALSSVDGEVPATGKPYCELDYADYELDVDLLGFEMRDKFGINFGYNRALGPLSRIGVGFQSESGKMSMDMILSETLRPLEELTRVIGEGTFTKTEFSIGFDLLMGIGVGTNVYSETPVGRLSEKTIKDSFKRTSKELEPITKAVEWKSRVVKILNPTKFIIPAGAIAGVRVGDKFKISNVQIEWSGLPCRSQVEFEEKKPVSVKAVVTQVQPKSALIEVYETVPDTELVELGAHVTIESLAKIKGESNRKSLKKAVRVRRVTSKPLELQDGKKIDIAPYMDPQVRAYLSDYGFYPRN